MKRILPLLLLPVVASGADSAASGFAADVAAGYSESPHGQLMIVSGSVDAVGDGETALSLWVGQSLAGMQCVERRAVTQTGTQTFRHQSPRALGDWDYWWVKMEQTPDGVTTNETWFPSYNTGNNWIYYRDGSFYEWTGPASGTWQDAANWTQTAEVEYYGAKTGYPAWEVTGGAIFPAGSSVDLSFSGDVNPDTLRLGAGASLALHGAQRAPRVAFDRVFATGSTVAGSGWRNLASFVVDGVDLWYTPVVGAVAAGASFVVTNGGRWVVGDDFWPQQGSGATVRLAPGSVLETRGVYLAIPDGLVEIDGATWIEDGEGFYTYTGGGGSKTVFKGDAPALVFTVASASCGSGKNVDCTLEFDLPAGGWTLPPVRGAAGGTKAFATPYNDNGKVVVSVPADCPAATSDGITDAVLVSWPGGFDETRIECSLPNPATDSYYVALNPTSSVPELHVRVFGQAQGEADPTVTAVTVGNVTRTGATFSAAVLPGGGASSATVSLLLSANGGAEFVATNETVSSSGTVVFPVDGLPSGATCTARFRVVNGYGRSAVSDPVAVRLLASYAEFTVSGAGVTLARADKDTIAAFTADGTFTVLRGGEAEVLVVAGGGAGGTGSGNYAGGGGGAGGVVHLENLWLDAGDYAVVVGAGGAATNNRLPGGNGGDSSFWSHRATGGGGGCGSSAGQAASGGSGGGGVGSSSYGPNAGIAGQGHDGGAGSSSSWIPGGGGGAGAAGAASAAGQAGAGGAGLSFVFGKTTYEVAGGGGGGAYNSAPGGATHGGGAGGASGQPGENGAAGTGGGGGGGSNALAGNGGSGIVLVRMRTGGNGVLVLVR